MIDKYYKYTDAEIKQILKNIVILCDTREQQNKHITSEFEKQGIQYKDYKLNVGDYSVMLPPMAELNINRPLYFDKSITIERKGSLDELASNLTKDRERLKDEFTRAIATGRQVYLIIEDSNGYDNILKHNYHSQLNEKAFIASLLSFQHKYNLNIVFLDKQNVASYIYNILYYYIRNTLV